MDISRITGGTSQSTIWSALMALSSKKTNTANAASTVSGATSPTATKALETAKKISVPSNLRDTLENVSASDSGLALIKALSTNTSSSAISSLFQSLEDSSTIDSTSSVDTASLFDGVLQGMSSGNTSDRSSRGSDLLQSLMSTSNSYSTLAGLSGTGSDVLSDSGSFEKILNSFMRLPDFTKNSAAVNNSLKSILDMVA
jgi:hypothetical protein